MSDTFSNQAIINLVEICAQKGMRYIIISPGSRSAPLTIAFARHADLDCRVVMDERAAAFIALGMAQQLQVPVGLVCTSGTAGLNYAPAVVEAYFQRIPLLVFTADRPPEWIDQQDGQTIRQTNLYGSHIRANFTLPVDVSHPDAQWYHERLISEAINTTLSPTPGPVHINVPLREPLYSQSNETELPLVAPKIINHQASKLTLLDEAWASLCQVWQTSEKKLILGGLHLPDAQLSSTLATLHADPTVAIIADLTANIHQYGAQFHQWDMAISTKSTEVLTALAPDLLITFGGQIVSKVVKQVLRKYPPREHWHIDPAGQTIDTFQGLTQLLPISSADFFEALVRQTTAPSVGKYTELWHTRDEAAKQAIATFLADVPFSELKAVYHIMQSLPEPSCLQLGNSMPIRYANYIGLAGRDIRVNANRGTSGIDGTVSTAVGAAMATNELVTLIVGDLGFFYDRNALWHSHIPANLRIVVLNNHGGGIFNLIDGPSSLPTNERNTYFETPHDLSAERTAADHGCAYFHCDNGNDLHNHLTVFFEPTAGAAILEVETNMAVNSKVFQQFKTIL